MALKGRELGIPPMQALSHIHIVEGKPTVSSELMVALVQRAGHKLRIIETSSEKCVVEGVRKDDPEYPQRLTWTMEDAKKAGVTNKGNWKNYPAAMLRARAISALCRFAFADVLMGASYTPEELGADVNEEGEVLAEPETSHAPAASPAVTSPSKLDDQNEAEAHEELLSEIVKLIGALPDDLAPDDLNALMDYANESWEKAVATKQHIERRLREYQATPESQEQEGDEAVEGEVVVEGGE